MTACQGARVVSPLSFINMSGSPAGPRKKSEKHHFKANGDLWCLVMLKEIIVQYLLCVSF